MFTDERHFALYKSDGLMLVWRERNEQYIEANTKARVPFVGGSVTVWGGILRNSKIDLVVLIGVNVCK